jgi:hypothetical protein
MVGNVVVAYGEGCLKLDLHFVWRSVYGRKIGWPPRFPRDIIGDNSDLDGPKVLIEVF